MKVLSVLHFPVFGGPHNRNARIGGLLRGNGVDTTLLLPIEADAAAERVRSHGCETLLMPLARLRRTLNPATHVRFMFEFRANVRAISDVIVGQGIDVVVVNGLMNPHAAIAARRTGRPVVWQILDSFPPPAVRAVMRPLVKQYATVVMSTGAQVARDHLGRPETSPPTVLFHPPVDLKRFSPSCEVRNRMRSELGFVGDAWVVGNVANVNPMKGHLTFVKAAVALRAQLPHANFVIFGQTYPHHAEYAKRVLDEARKAGFVPGHDFRIVDPGRRVDELAQALDLYWVSSEPRSEGISTAAEEAMALGIPVVSTATGSMAEIVRDGETGFMVGERDADGLASRSLQIAMDPELHRKMCAGARNFALGKFDVSRCAQIHHAAYRAALGDLQALETVELWR
jgi:glycosyltransferase involved in cell wall biosynthesis